MKKAQKRNQARRKLKKARVDQGQQQVKVAMERGRPNAPKRG